MQVNPRREVYSPREIALAAGVPEEQVVAAVDRRPFVPYPEAVRIGRTLIHGGGLAGVSPVTDPLFSIFSRDDMRSRINRVPLALSSTLHVGVMAAVMFIATFGPTPTAMTLDSADRPPMMRLVFVDTPGPGGGGGGGGVLQKRRPPKALQEGHHAVSSPLPIRRPPEPVEPMPAPPEPKPALLNAEPLPIMVAPIVSAPADARSRAGLFEQTSAEDESRGSGRLGGVGSGTGTGLGEGEGTGIGPGSGGGTGGGPYRPGSGIEPPRVLREVKADYTEDARRRGINGDVVLEIVVQRDGSVGEVKLLQGLGGGLNERAVQAVRQWRFLAARRQGTPVDVIVEVAVEFKLR